MSNKKNKTVRIKDMSGNDLNETLNCIYGLEAELNVYSHVSDDYLKSVKSAIAKAKKRYDDELNRRIEAMQQIGLR